MNRKTLCLMLTCLILALVSSAAARDLGAKGLPDGVAIEAFGLGGERLPALARAVLTEGYFTRDLIESITHRQNYGTSFRPPRSVESFKLVIGGESTSETTRVPVENLSLRVILKNAADRPNDISISARHLGEHRSHNFVVQVEPGEKIVIDADGVVDADLFYLTSMQAFEARVELDADGRVWGQGLEVAEPIRRPEEIQNKVVVDYCTETQRFIWICAMGGSGCSIGWADRYDTGRTWASTGEPIYYVDIDYPSIGSPFHIGNSAGRADYTPACDQTSYMTHRVDYSRQHSWSMLDRTLFLCSGSSAYCNMGCEDPGVPDSFSVSCL